MFGVISFGFKILFASIIGGALSYIPDESKNNQDILETSLICIFSASVLGLICQIPNKGEYFAIGFGVLAVVIVVITMSKNFEFRQRIMWVFAAVIGMIIGYGFLIQACLLGALIYLILNNDKYLLDYIHKKPEEMNDVSI